MLTKLPQCKKNSPEFNTKYHSVEQLIEIKMSTVVLLLNQDGISELIKIANDIQGRIDRVMSVGQKPRDRMADASAPSTFLEVAKEKLPMIMEEGEDLSVATTSEFQICCRNLEKQVMQRSERCSAFHNKFFMFLYITQIP